MISTWPLMIAEQRRLLDVAAGVFISRPDPPPLLALLHGFVSLDQDGVRLTQIRERDAVRHGQNAHREQDRDQPLPFPSASRSRYAGISGSPANGRGSFGRQGTPRPVALHHPDAGRLWRRSSQSHR